MTRPVRVVGCLSSEVKQQYVFRSMISIFSRGSSSGLAFDWVFSEEGPFDVRIVDLDDQENTNLTAILQGETIIVISSKSQSRPEHRYVLTKPPRTQTFLQILQAIEAVEHEAVRSTAPTPPRGTGNNSVSTALPGERPGVLRLLVWPDLGSLPEENMIDAARVCALLAVNPCEQAAIAELLQMQPESVNSILALISQAAYPGCQALSTNVAAPARTAATAEQHEAAPAASFLKKIWSRLKGAA